MDIGAFTAKALVICAVLMTLGRIAVAAFDSYHPETALGLAPAAQAPERPAAASSELLAAFATSPAMVRPLPTGARLAYAVPAAWNFDRSAQEWWETF